jgi:hypothetical protein
MANERAYTPSTTTQSRASSVVLNGVDQDTPASLHIPMAMTPPLSIASLRPDEPGLESIRVSTEGQLEMKSKNIFKPYQ